MLNLVFRVAITVLMNKLILEKILCLFLAHICLIYKHCVFGERTIFHGHLVSLFKTNPLEVRVRVTINLLRQIKELGLFFKNHISIQFFALISSMELVSKRKTQVCPEQSTRKFPKTHFLPICTQFTPSRETYRNDRSQ